MLENQKREMSELKDSEWIVSSNGGIASRENLPEYSVNVNGTENSCKLLVGIKEIDGDRFKPLTELVSSKPIPEKSRVHFYMRCAKCIAASSRRAHDLFTSELIQEELRVFSDGEYIWSTDTLYYFDKYNLCLPHDFINKAKNWHPVSDKK